jgi:hypothetical protein
VDTQLAIRRFADDHILASCTANNVPGFELHDRPGLDENAYDTNGLASWLEPSGYRLNDGAGAYLDDDHVLVGVFTAAYDKDETELHLVLSTRSLQWVATVDYGQYGLPRANSIVRGHDGRWLTYDWQAGIATLWEPHHITQEAQPALFDVPWRADNSARSTRSIPRARHAGTVRARVRPADQPLRGPVKAPLSILRSTAANAAIQYTALS